MKKSFHNPKQLFEPRVFTHAVGVSGARMVFVSGQVSYDRDGIVIGQGDIREQSEQVFRALGHCLRAAGASWSDVVKLNSYMVGPDSEAVNIYREVRARYLVPGQLPASTLVGVERLVHEDLLLEVELVAAVAEKAPKPAARRRARNKKPTGR
ncbi:MAG: RidA family protein [Betaproteobacteria bacterium]|nr:RidA family protein [Betaproteobacteria bacterium]